MKLFILTLYALLHLAALTLPLFFDSVEVTEITGAQALLCIVFSWTAFLVADLNLRQILMATAAFVAAGTVFCFAAQFGILDAAWFGQKRLLLEARPIFWRALATGTILQLIAAGLLASGFWMKRNRAPYIFRRAGTNRQERDHLFDLRQTVKADAMTNFKYVSLQSSCPGVVLEYRGEIIAYFRYVNLETRLVLFDFIILPEARNRPHSRELLGMFRYFFGLPGIASSHISAMLGPEDADALVEALLEASGFVETAPQEEAELKSTLSAYRLAGFEDWQPFSGELRILNKAA